MYLSRAYREGFYLACEYAPSRTIALALLPPLVLSPYTLGKSLTSIWIDAFIQRENYRRALLLYFVPLGEILWLVYGESSVYVRGSFVHARAL